MVLAISAGPREVRIEGGKEKGKSTVCSGQGVSGEGREWSMAATQCQGPSHLPPPRNSRPRAMCVAMWLP